MIRHRDHGQSLNPYIALADMSITLMLIFSLMLPLIMLLGNRGWDEMKYRSYQDQFARAIRNALSQSERPQQINRHDAPGEQRWMFNKKQMFVSNDISDMKDPELTPYGKHVLKVFAGVLKKHENIWWRVRVEAHVHQNSNPTDYLKDEGDSIRFTSKQATLVYVYLFKLHIHPWQLTQSGRGHQDLLDVDHRTSEINDRVDLLIIPPPKNRVLAPILFR